MHRVNSGLSYPEALLCLTTVEPPTTDSAYTETYAMESRSHGPKSLPIVYSTLLLLYSGNLPTLNYGH